MRVAGPRYTSWFHQYDGQEVEQHAQRMHSYILWEPAWVRVPQGRNDCHVPVELTAILLRLEEFAIRWRVVVLQVRFDRLVLLVELGEVGDEVLDNIHWGQVCC